MPTRPERAHSKRELMEGHAVRVCMSMRVACGHHHHIRTHTRVCGWWTLSAYTVRASPLDTPKNDCLCLRLDSGVSGYNVLQPARSSKFKTEKLVPLERPSARDENGNAISPSSSWPLQHCLLWYLEIFRTKFRFQFAASADRPLASCNPSATLAQIRPFAERGGRWCKQPSQSPRCSFKNSRALAEAAAADA